MGGTETNEVLDALRARGYRMTPQRRAIVSEIIGTKGHIAPQVIAQKVKARVPGVNTSTVYRTLDLLEGLGVVHHAHMEAGAEYHRSERHDHVHLVCSSCGRSQSLAAVEAEPLEDIFEKRTRFAPDFTHFAIAGLCEPCRQRGPRAGTGR
jgi:Fur family ferric uptake transcriptional regulator